MTLSKWKNGALIPPSGGPEYGTKERRVFERKQFSIAENKSKAIVKEIVSLEKNGKKEEAQKAYRMKLQPLICDMEFLHDYGLHFGCGKRDWDRVSNIIQSLDSWRNNDNRWIPTKIEKWLKN